MQSFLENLTCMDFELIKKFKFLSVEKLKGQNKF